MRQVLALFGALLHGSLYLVLGATTLLPQALRAALRAASRQRTSLLQARARALLQRRGCAAGSRQAPSATQCPCSQPALACAAPPGASTPPWCRRAPAPSHRCRQQSARLCQPPHAGSDRPLQAGQHCQTSATAC